MKLAAISSLILLSLPAQAQIVSSAAQSQNIVSQYNSVKQHPVAGARAYAPVPTSDCMGSSGIGGQAPFWGFGFSTTTHSRPCNIRENAKFIGLTGDTELSERIIITLVCEDASMKKALPECGQTIQSTDVCKYPTDECKQSKRFK